MVPFPLLVSDWRGFAVSFFALVFAANVYPNMYSRLRVGIAQAKVETERIENEVERESS
ncbi:MAG: hypothetical protein ACREJC_03885 [Tepidisphaeraceae bacterium]